MSKLSKKNKIAMAIAGAVALTTTFTASANTEVKKLQAADTAIQKAAEKSQEKVNKLYDQAQNLVFDYRQVIDDTDNLRSYNDYVATLVADQEAKIAGVQADIDSIDKTRQGLVPLMFKMIDTIEEFVSLDLPFEKKERADRIAFLKEMMVDSNVSTAEKYRKVLEAYQIEMDSGRTSQVYQGKESIGGVELTVDVLQVGRVTLVAQTLDSKRSWVWNKEAKGWDELGEEWRRPIRNSIDIVRKDKSPDLIKLPVPAVGSAK
ncbi:DUF3450 domain-containing protein [Psychrobium sp. 1_MG-2023]|uniref:DUF3450 domain-containing protein n=1 Tax=Psychrobium sp. 1_MG-2023 TaxID=3062624 RepID=UPI000C32E451|nr:DUF3450 domain-containing protein [Psychrobium sp. 1_MG-2023]MDP2559944.1 DUF3450 domain-containing protein [Psychrobium sp. 1_MG-2023]PKF56388.1 hypothetical protein CW748_10570 [Alteromonadales bacterium alter-6D02]